MNLEAKLNDSLNDVLRTSGYIFEIIRAHKKQSNLITGTNNQLIAPAITLQLSNSIAKFDDILDDTISKFNDARWCIEQILDNKQRQEEQKLKEEIERQKKKQEEELEQKRKEEEQRKRKEEEEQARIRAEEERQRKEQEQKQAQEARDKEAKEKEANHLRLQSDSQKQQEENSKRDDGFGDFMLPSFDFNLNEVPAPAEKSGPGIPNPSDILLSIKYNDNFFDEQLKESGTEASLNQAAEGEATKEGNFEDLDLDMNNILGNDELILDGLNMSLLDQGFDTSNVSGSGGNNLGEEEFDVDNFLNQFGGAE